MALAKRIALTLVFMCFGTILFAQELVQGYNMDLTLELAGIDEAGPPRTLQDQVLFTYQSNRPVRYVGVAFAHEGYSEVHQFRLNTRTPDDEEGTPSRVFFYLHNPPEDLEQIRYRYVVDGQWMADPRNGRTQVDSNGVPVSVFELPGQPDRAHANPIVSSNRRVSFRLVLPEEGSPGLLNIRGGIGYLSTTQDLRVYVTGSFNNWDPYMHRLEPVEGSPGSYEIEGLRLPPGQHRYYFMINGRRFLDPHNSRTSYMPEDGYEVSAFTLRRASTNNDL